jgi:hypothetical protein
MLLSFDFPRDGEVLEPSGIQARPELDPNPFDLAQGRGEHSRTTIKIFGGDAFGINYYRHVLIPRQPAAG